MLFLSSYQSTLSTCLERLNNQNATPSRSFARGECARRLNRSLPDAFYKAKECDEKTGRTDAGTDVTKNV